jgi:hypothetical protein
MAALIGLVAIAALFFSYPALLALIPNRPKPDDPRYKAALLEIEAARLNFDLKSAEVVNESYEVNRSQPYSLTQVLRLPEGEYVWIKTTPRGVMHKELSEEAARSILGRRFRRPGA